MWKMNTEKLEKLIDSLTLCSTASQPMYNKIIMDNSEMDYNKMNNHVNLIMSFIFNTTPYLDKQDIDTRRYTAEIIWNKCVMEI